MQFQVGLCPYVVLILAKIIGQKNTCSPKYCPVILRLESNTSSVHREDG